MLLGVYKSVADAAAVVESETPPTGWMMIAKALDPRLAVTNAVDAALNE
jgi:hypothetical protein